jgi:hypothetical protein
VENGRRGTEPENPGNGGQNAPPDVKSPEIRKAEIAMAKTGRAAKTPQIPERREENRPRPKKRQIPENGGQNTPPDLKSPEIRKAEKAVAKTGCKAKNPQIPAFREQNRPRHKKRQIPGNGGQNASPDVKSQTPGGRRGGDPSSHPALPVVNAYPRKSAYISV